MIDLFAPGAYARTAGGNIERPNDQKQAIDWIAWSLNSDNGGGGGKAIWDTARAKWDAANLPNFPWMHVRKMDDLLRLISVAEGENSPAIGLNIENIVGDGLSLQEVGGYVLDFWVNRYEKPVHMATLPWVQNGQGWQHLAFAVAALEIFPDEQAHVFPGGIYDPAKVADCIEHAFTEGLTKVTLMLKTKGYTPASYGDEYKICHSLYTADDVPPSAAGWKMWEQDQPCVSLKPPEVPTVPLTAKQFPFTGPLYGESHPSGPSLNKSTTKGLKRALIRLGFLDQKLGSETDDYGPECEQAMVGYQRAKDIKPHSGQYGRESWLSLRSARIESGPNAGKYAMDALALKYVREDLLTRCYPHPVGAMSEICQGPHPTAGLLGNWAIDFCAPGGTKVLAVERATIRKLSGRDPSWGAEQTVGIFGWSIHYETAEGYRYFSTHYGSRANLSVGQVVDVGQAVGTVGHWPGDPTRSHTHLGVTSPLGTTDAKKRITAISLSPKIVA